MSRRITKVALVFCTIGVVINVVDAIVTGRFEPHDVFPAFVALGAGSELLKKRRPKVARALYCAASVLLVVAGSVAGYGAWSGLFRGAAIDWLNLVLGVLVVFYAAVCVGQLFAWWSSRKASRSSRDAQRSREASPSHEDADVLGG